MKRVMLVLVFLGMWCLGPSTLLASAGPPGAEKATVSRPGQSSGDLVIDVSGAVNEGINGDPGDAGDGLGADDDKFVMNPQDSYNAGKDLLSRLLVLMLRLRMLP